MMSLCFSGCSITYGDELENKEQERFSRLVSDHYGLSDNNISLCGASNDDIVRRTVKYLEKNEVDILIIQFTYISRYQWVDESGKYQNWTTSFQNDLRHNHTPRKQWYKHVYTNHYGLENAWKNIFLIDRYCKSRNQKYISLVNNHDERFYNIECNWKKLYNGDMPIILQCKNSHPNLQEHKTISDVVMRRIDEITV